MGRDRENADAQQKGSGSPHERLDPRIAESIQLEPREPCIDSLCVALWSCILCRSHAQTSGGPKKVTRHDDLNLQTARSIPVNHTRVIPQSHDRSRAKGGVMNLYNQPYPPLSLSFTTPHTCLEHPLPPPSYSLKTHLDYNHEQWLTSHYLE